MDVLCALIFKEKYPAGNKSLTGSNLTEVKQLQIDETLFKRLEKSGFRSSFRLKGKELDYLRTNGIDVILSHGRDFLNSRIRPAVIENDGKQTPMKNHPFFIAQHATGMCCRKCLYKWHGIKKGRELSDGEIEYLLSVASVWLRKYL